MLVQASPVRRSAHVIVLGNEKGGSGKSTTAFHVVIALLKAGQRVASIDLDSRQKTFTNYIGNRDAWSRRSGVHLELPQHVHVALGSSMQIAENEAFEFEQFSQAIVAVEKAFDFIVIDTPGSDTYLMRLAHSMADTLITPINDSFVDFDVLGTVDPMTYWVNGENQYANMVKDARRQRRMVDGATMDWIVVRNRLSHLSTRNKVMVGEALERLAATIGFRPVDGFAERIVYRELFPRGLTALDDLNLETLGTRPNMAHITAREEVLGFLRHLKLPLDERGRRRAAARAEWFAAADLPLESHGLVEI